LDDRRRDGGTNSTLRTKEQGTHLTLNEHDDDDDDEHKSILKLEIRVVAGFNTEKSALLTHKHTHNTDYTSIQRSLSAVYNENIPSPLRDI